MFNIDQEGSCKIMNYPRYANSAPYLGINWSGIPLGSRTTRDHQEDLQLFSYFFLHDSGGDISLCIWCCNKECLLFNAALVLRSFGQFFSNISTVSLLYAILLMSYFNFLFLIYSLFLLSFYVNPFSKEETTIKKKNNLQCWKDLCSPFVKYKMQ